MEKVFVILALISLTFGGVEIWESGEDFIRLQMTANPEIIGNEFGEYSKIVLDGADFCDITGQPRLPVFREMILIPDGCELVIHPQDRIVQQVSLSNLVEPVPIFETQSNSQPLQLSRHYYEDININSYPAEIIQEGRIHGYNYAIIEFRPVSYNPIQGMLEIINEMDILISYRGGEWPDARYNSSVFNQMIIQTALNPFEVEPTPANPIGYYVICPDEYLDAVEPLLEWRRQMGYFVTVISPESLGGTTSDIKDAITTEYHFGEVVPDYIVFVGDVDVIPTYSSGGSDSPTDADYCTVDGDDFVPDILYGRISGADAEDIARIANRVVEYEKLTYDDISFTNRVLFGTTDDGSFHDYVHVVHQHCIDTWIEPADVSWTEMDGPSTSMDEVVVEINSGYNFYYYYGHGSPAGLASPPLNFAGIDLLSNNNKFPFMVGNACSTNDYTDGESWGEALLRRDNKGAIAYMGASEVTYWYPDSIWEIETFAALYEHGYSTVDGICYYALLEVNIGMPSYGHYFFDVYNLVGDPATHLWKKSPSELTVEHTPAFVPGDTNAIEITVMSEGAPVENALIGLRIPGGNLAAYTDDSGNATIDYFAEVPDEIILTATKPDYIPVQDTLIAVSMTEPYIFISNAEIIDSDSLSEVNNENGMLDIGEAAIIRLTVVNYGLDASEISIYPLADSYISDFGFDCSIGLLPSLADTIVYFICAVDFDVPDEAIANYNFNITADGGYERIQSKEFTIHAPILEYISFELSDVDGGDGDYLPEAGETVEFRFNYANIGTGSPNDIAVSITEDADFIELIDPIFYVGPVLGNSNYSIIVDANIIDDPREGASVFFDVNQDYLDLGWEDTFTVIFNAGGFASEILPGEGWSADGFHLDDVTFASPPYSLQSTSSGEMFYENDTDNYAETPFFMVPMNSRLTFWQQIHTPVNPTTGDYGRVYLITETDTVQLGSDFTGQIDDWQLVKLDIPSEYQNRSAKLRFTFTSSDANYRRGWNIDDIKVKPSGIDFLGGHSIEPFVGIAEEEFTFSIKYASADGSMPDDTIFICIEGYELFCYPMEFMGGSLTDGAIYQKALGAFMEETYYFQMGDTRYPEEDNFVVTFTGFLIYEEDFEDGPGDFIVEGDDDWQHTALSSGSHSGNFCFSTLGPAFGGYDSEANSRLVLPMRMPLYECYVEFYAKYDFAVGSSSGLLRDGGNIKLQIEDEEETLIYPVPLYDGEIISSTNPLSGEPVYGEENYDDWRRFQFHLMAHPDDSIRIIFDFGSNDIEQADGWFIDDFKIILAPYTEIDEDIMLKPEMVSISAYPNPFNSTVRLDFDNFTPENIEIIDYSGRVIDKLSTTDNSINWQPNSSIESGVYFIKANNGDNSLVERVLYIK